MEVGDQNGAVELSDVGNARGEQPLLDEGAQVRNLPRPPVRPAPTWQDTWRRLEWRAMWALNMLACPSSLGCVGDLSARNIFVVLLGQVTVFSIVCTMGEPGEYLDSQLCLVAAGVFRLISVPPMPALLSFVLVRTLLVSIPPTTAKWILMGMMMTAEIFWWPSLDYLVETDFSVWCRHFIMTWTVLCAFWYLPEAPNWLVGAVEQAAETTQHMDTQTTQAATPVFVTIGVLVGIPFAGCLILSYCIMCRQLPRVCILIVVAMTAVVVVVLAGNLSEDLQVWLMKAVLCLLMVALCRESFSLQFAETKSWQGLALLCAVLLAIDLTFPLSHRNLAGGVLFLCLVGKLHIVASRRAIENSRSIFCWRNCCPAPQFLWRAPRDGQLEEMNP
mmetsp:Transcript_10385/g.22753  ORF Transcript_10385/g.22753 Transcript_10385/m.22753 type:complete len:389 (+) Transcript_10385:52-1218(+)